jgi:hypothetical protein
MKNSWIQTFRRLAAATVVAGTTMYSSAMCYANAFDSATDPVYADGWQAGDNGGSGFTPWNFDSDPGTVGTHTIDTTSAFDALKPAWRLANDPDITRAGRGFAPLQVGQTVSMTIDNPGVRQFFKGYIVRLNSGGGNICYGGAPCTVGTTPKERVSAFRFEYFNYGLWQSSDLAGSHNTTLFDTDTAAAGARFDFTLTGPETYTMTMDPFGPGPTYTQSGALANTGSGPINWMEFVMFNKTTDPTQPTDFYIGSIQVIPEPATCTLLAAGAGALVGATGRRRKQRE